MPQQQIDALKTQLAELQKTLATLEQSLQQPAEPAKKGSPQPETVPQQK